MVISAAARGAGNRITANASDVTGIASVAAGRQTELAPSIDDSPQPGGKTSAGGGGGKWEEPRDSRGGFQHDGKWSMAHAPDSVKEQLTETRQTTPTVPFLIGIGY